MADKIPDKGVITEAQARELAKGKWGFRKDYRGRYTVKLDEETRKNWAIETAEDANIVKTGEVGFETYDLVRRTDGKTPAHYASLPADERPKPVAATVAGGAVRIGGTILGTAAGATRGQPGMGAFMGGVTAEPLARRIEQYLMREPQRDPGPAELAAAGATSMIGGNIGGRAIGGPVRQGMVTGGAQGAITEAGRQADAGEMDAAAMGRATALGTGLGAVIGKVIGGPRNVKQGPIEPTPIAAAEKEATELAAVPGTPRANVKVEPTSTELAAPQDPAFNVTKKVIVETAEGTGPQRELGLVTSVKNSLAMDDALKSAVDGFYNQKSNQETYARVYKLLAEVGEDRARIVFASDHGASAESSALGLELVRRYQSAGRHNDAADVVMQLAQRAKSQGQAVQILSTLSRMSPEGSLLYARKMKGAPLLENESKAIATLQGAASAAKAPEVQLAKSAELFEYVNKLQPVPLDQKLRSFANVAMLLNPKTLIRNIAGNTVMSGFEMAADAIAVPVDAATSVFTQKGAVYGPQVAERLKGLMQPAKDFKAGYEEARSLGMTPIQSTREGLQTVSTLARLSALGKYDVGDVNAAARATFSNPVAASLEKTLGVAMGVPDRAFYTASLKSSIANRMQAARDAGQELLVPDADMMAAAHLDAARAVFQDDNFVSKSLGQLRKVGNQLSTAGKSTEIGAGQAILPFTRVPGSILLRGVEFSPAGYIRTLYEGVAPVLGKREFDQKAFVDSFSRATTGTAGAIGAGYLLGNLGVITPVKEEDPEIESLKKGIGAGAYKINATALKRRMIAMDFDPRERAWPDEGRRRHGVV
jgi:hypothetical protein